MSEQSPEQPSDDGPLSVPDDDLPEDLRPSEDNPLAQPTGDEVPDDLLKDTAGSGSSDESGDARRSEDAGGAEDGPDDDA